MMVVTTTRKELVPMTDTPRPERVTTAPTFAEKVNARNLEQIAERVTLSDEPTASERLRALTAALAQIQRDGLPATSERVRAFTAALLQLQEDGLLVRFPTSTASRPIQRPASTSDARKRNAENRSKEQA